MSQQTQCHRTAEAGRHLWKSPSPTPPLPKQGQLWQLVQGCGQLGFLISPRTETLQPSWATYSCACGCSSPGTGLCTFLCSTLWDVSWSISPACPDPSVWQHSHLVCRTLLPVLCHLQTCGKCMMCQHPGHWWRWSAVLAPVFTRLEHH